MVRTTDSVFIREVSFIQSALYREVPLSYIPGEVKCWWISGAIEDLELQADVERVG